MTGFVVVVVIVVVIAIEFISGGGTVKLAWVETNSEKHASEKEG